MIFSFTILGSEIISFSISQEFRLFEIAGVVMRLDHIASFIVNANHSVSG
jgi:hypothetical protein